MSPRTVSGALLGMSAPLDGQWHAVTMPRQIGKCSRMRGHNIQCRSLTRDTGIGYSKPAMRTLFVLLLSASVAQAQGFYDKYPWFPQLVGAQFTYIWQDLPPFHAPYSGRLSLENTG